MEAEYIVNYKRPYEIHLLNINKLMFKSVYDLKNITNHRLCMFELLDVTERIRKWIDSIEFPRDWAYSCNKWRHERHSGLDDYPNEICIKRSKGKYRTWYIKI